MSDVNLSFEKILEACDASLGLWSLWHKLELGLRLKLLLQGLDIKDVYKYEMDMLRSETCPISTIFARVNVIQIWAIIFMSFLFIRVVF